MAIILPTAPKNFYDPSLTTLKNVLDALNGNTKGQLVLINDVPNDIENCWGEVGVAGNTIENTNKGSMVIGHADLLTITGPVAGDTEASDEPRYKLQFNEIPEITVYLDGSGVSTSIIKGIALVAGVDTFSFGVNDNVKYLLKVNDVSVTDGSILRIPGFEIIIGYSEEVSAGVS